MDIKFNYFIGQSEELVRKKENGRYDESKENFRIYIA